VTDHIPAPAEHSPRKRAQLLGDDFVIEETENPDTAWILCSVADTIPIKE